MASKKDLLLKTAAALKNALDEIDRNGPSLAQDNLAHSYVTEIDLCIVGEARTQSYSVSYKKLEGLVKAYTKVEGRSAAARKERGSIFDSISKLLTEIVLNNALASAIPEGAQQVSKTPKTSSRTGQKEQINEASIRHNFDENLSTLLNVSMLKPKYPNIYILGCFERKKTLLTQQQRAMLLATGILKYWGRDHPPRVAIVGGGVAGTTAMCTLLKGGAEVRLFERSSQLMKLQRKSELRYLHPHLYDWPISGSDRNLSNLPFLNWSAGYGKDVIETLDLEIASILKDTGAEAPITNYAVQDIEPDQNGKYTISSDDLGPVTDFDVVILAIGFGVEHRPEFPAPVPSYWENHPIHRLGVFDAANKGQLLISGCGDGALVDVLRGAFEDFEHSKILSLVPELHDGKLQEELLNIERLAKGAMMPTDSDSFLFSKHYDELLDGIQLSDEVLAKLAPHYQVTFNSTRIGKFKLGTSVLNRVLVHLMISNGIVTFRKGKILNIETRIDKDSGRRIFQVDWGSKSGEFDDVIVRYGVDSKKHFKRQFPELFKAGEQNFDSYARAAFSSDIPVDLGDILERQRRIWA